jgi:hypothetical protein
LGKFGIALLFPWVRRDMSEVMLDHRLASLGDSFVNLVYSLAISNETREPRGIKVKGSILAEAVRKAGLRGELPSRMSSHALADAAEALLIYAWLSDCISLRESVETVMKSNDPVEGLAKLLATAKTRITFP